MKYYIAVLLLSSYFLHGVELYKVIGHVTNNDDLYNLWKYSDIEVYKHKSLYMGLVKLKKPSRTLWATNAHWFEVYTCVEYRDSSRQCPMIHDRSCHLERKVSLVKDVIAYLRQSMKESKSVDHRLALATTLQESVEVDELLGQYQGYTKKAIKPVEDIWGYNYYESLVPYVTKMMADYESWNTNTYNHTSWHSIVRLYARYRSEDFFKQEKPLLEEADPQFPIARLFYSHNKFKRVFPTKQSGYEIACEQLGREKVEDFVNRKQLKQNKLYCND